MFGAGIVSMMRTPYVKRATISTTDATQTAIVTIPTENDTSIIVIADAIATKDDGSIALAGRILNSFNNDGGVLTRKSTFDTNAYMYQASSDYAFVTDVNSTNVRLLVTGAAATNLTWKIEYHVFVQ